MEERGDSPWRQYAVISKTVGERREPRKPCISPAYKKIR